MAIYKYIVFYLGELQWSLYFPAQNQFSFVSGVDPVSLRATSCAGWWDSLAGPSDFPERQRRVLTSSEIFHYCFVCFTSICL